jgi:hypothetical protein
MDLAGEAHVCLRELEATSRQLTSFSGLRRRAGIHY